MAKTEKELPEVVQAAVTLEEEIARLEAISRATRKARLSSQKTIARAAAELKEMLTFPTRITERLQAVTAAFAKLQERQQAALAPLGEFAKEVQRRSQQLEEHMKSYAALGQAANDLNAMLSKGEVDLPSYAIASSRLQEISEGAKKLFEAARDDDFPDLAREADVMKQKMAELRKRLPSK